MVPAPDNLLSATPPLVQGAWQLLPPPFPPLLVPVNSGLGMSVGAWHGLAQVLGLP